jgi:hypothetical protein
LVVDNVTFHGIQVLKVLPSQHVDALTFSDYVLQLPLWDQRLLSDINLADTAGLLAHLQSDVPLYLVSDGGADADSGSFGALAADADKIFVSLSGTTEGISPGSFRAESYGCLAILRLVYHLVVFHAIPPPVIHHRFFCDNKGLLSRLSRATKQKPFPRHYLRSDMDIEMQILDTLRLLEMTLTFKHVKGHQDSADATQDLPREAILNIECDRLASLALQHAVHTPKVQFMPASQISVTVAGVTITRRIARTIRDLVGRSSQAASFARRYGWSAEQFSAVDWHHYRTVAYKFSLPKRFFLIKWLNDVLPF